MKTVGVRIALLLVMLPLPVLAGGLEVSWDEQTDFSRFRTYEWKEGAVASKPDVQSFIVRTVERELAAKGLTPASAGQADLRVATYVFSQMEIASFGTPVWLRGWDAAILFPTVNSVEAGTYAVVLQDSSNDKLVWGGIAQGTLGHRMSPPPDKLKKKVDKVTEKMFRSYPPPATAPDASTKPPK